MTSTGDKVVDPVKVGSIIERLKASDLWKRYYRRLFSNLAKSPVHHMPWTKKGPSKVSVVPCGGLLSSVAWTVPADVRILLPGQGLLTLESCDLNSVL
jgi:hypothetical protein